MSANRCQPCFHSALSRLMAGGLVIAFALALVGCSRPPSRIVIPPVTLYSAPPGMWRVIDEQILAASEYARNESEAYARITMDDWRERVRRRTEDVFIPWYSSYWTQQWIATKVAWYKLRYAEGEPTPEERLVSFLQEQFFAQVLKPVSSFVDPHAIMEDTADRYLRELKGRLNSLPFEHHIPVDAFNQHLDTIPAIVVLAKPLQDASLYEVLQATDLTALPAYKKLLAQITTGSGSSGPTPSQDRLHEVARRAVTKLVGTLALRGGTAAASTILGGFWGLLISTGSAAWSVLEHDRDKPGMEMQLRKNLDAALEVMWQALVDDQQSGVTAVVYHMSEHIEDAVLHSPQTPPQPNAPGPDELF